MAEQHRSVLSVDVSTMCNNEKDLEMFKCKDGAHLDFEMEVPVTSSRRAKVPSANLDTSKQIWIRRAHSFLLNVFMLYFNFSSPPHQAL
jgi:hypothetical protein